MINPRHLNLILIVSCVAPIIVCHIHLSRSHFNQLLDPGDHDFTPAPGRSQHDESSCPLPGDCVPPVQCPAHVHGIEPGHCMLVGGRIGVCCTTGQKHTGTNKNRASHVTISKEILNSVAKSSETEVSQLFQKSNVLSSKRSAVVLDGSPSYGHLKNFRVAHPGQLEKIVDLSQRALHMIQATRNLKHREGYTNEQFEFDQIESNLQSTPLEAACVRPPICPIHYSRYRSIDGSCNNPVDSSLGVAFTPFSRLLPPSYEDGIWTPRLSKHHRQPLPSPRLVSSVIFSDVDRPDKQHTVMLMQFGQFLSHDFSRTVITRHENGSGIACCSENGVHQLPPEMTHYACMPILISPHDYFYHGYGQKCMNFVRSVMAPRKECNLGYSQQMNRVSHFIDGSAIYGADTTTVNDLREFFGGRLRMQNDYGRDLLPSTKFPEDCLTMEQGSACYAAGDTRCNQMISLVAIHTLFAREHNRIAGQLSHLNPHWSDETLFLEARRILTAELQHIVYSEWLPEVIGYNTINEFDLNVDRPGYSTNYDPKVDPSITNEFITAAMRFGHSIVDGKMKIYGQKKIEEILDIPEVMFYPSRMRRREFFDAILTTLTIESPQMADTSVTDSLTKYLFRAGNPFGLDLIAINIQRGRDHGLRSYNDYRELVGLPRYHSFNDLGPEISQVLSKLYATPDDIDLYVGGLMETIARGSIVGPTFRDMIADQFSRLRKGDKYFYDLHPTTNPGSFSQEQLIEIKKSSLSRLICDNSDRILIVRQAKNAFRKPGLPGNELYDCNSPAIPNVNLIYWQEHF